MITAGNKSISSTQFNVVQYLNIYLKQILYNTLPKKKNRTINKNVTNVKAKTENKKFDGSMFLKNRTLYCNERKDNDRVSTTVTTSSLGTPFII